MVILELSRGFPDSNYPMNGIFEWDQAKALNSLGHKVIFLALDTRSFRRKRRFGLTITNVNGIEVYNFNIPLGAVPRPITDHVMWMMFRKAYKRIIRKYNNIDIVHAHFGRVFGKVVLKSSKTYNIPYIITEHDSIVNNDLVSKKEKAQLKKAYSCAKKRIAVSPTFARRMEELYDEKFVYIPNIVDIDEFLNVKKRTHNGINIISVGNLTDNKSMDITIKAFAKAKTRNPDINTLNIVGEGTCLEKLKKIALNEGISNNIKFWGRLSRSEIAKLYETSDIFVLASKSETFGVVYIEAMCAGLPVIATRCGGPEGLFTDLEGLYVDIDDVEGLGEAMNHIAANLELYKSDVIKEYCIDHYAPNSVAQNLVATIGDIK